MFTHRRCRRITRFALASGPLLAAAIMCAGPAEADAASFLSHVHGAGIHETQGGDAALLQTGQKLCAEMRSGATPLQLSSLALQRSNSSQGGNGLSPAQADALISYARVDLCPGAVEAPGEPQWPGAAGIP